MSESEDNFMTRWRRWMRYQRKGLQAASTRDVGSWVLVITLPTHAGTARFVVPIDRGAYPDRPVFFKNRTKDDYYNVILEEGDPEWRHHFSLMPPQPGDIAFLFRKNEIWHEQPPENYEKWVALSPMRKAYCESGIVTLSCTSSINYAEYHDEGLVSVGSERILDHSKDKNVFDEDTLTWTVDHSNDEYIDVEVILDDSENVYRDAVIAGLEYMKGCLDVDRFNSFNSSKVNGYWSHLDNGTVTEQYNVSKYAGISNYCLSSVLNRKYDDEDKERWESAYLTPPWDEYCVYRSYRSGNTTVDIGDKWVVNFTWADGGDSTCQKGAYVFNYCIPEPDCVKRVIFEFCLEGKALNARPDIKIYLGRGIVDVGDTASAKEQAKQLAQIERSGIKGHIEKDEIIRPADYLQNKDIRHVVVSFETFQWNEHDTSDISSGNFIVDGEEVETIHFNQRMGAFSIIITGEPLIDTSYDRGNKPSSEDYRISLVSPHGTNRYLQSLHYPIMIPVYAKNDFAIGTSDEQPEQPEEDSDGEE